MKRVLLLAAILALVGAPIRAADTASLTGEYVEARTAEVFTCGCIMGSEAYDRGHQAVLAWHIERGTFEGVPLDGLAVVAVVAGDRNLGSRDLGATPPRIIKSVVIVDERATPAQRGALVALVRRASNGLVRDIVEMAASPIEFRRNADQIQVTARHVNLAVATELPFDPRSGDVQWYQPLGSVDNAAIGLTLAQAFSGGALGVTWSDPGKKSAFFGTFQY